MEPLAISFLLHSTYDLLPNATNLKLWGYTDSDLCFPCKSGRGTLRHVLSACPHLLQMYTWWHSKVLEVVIGLLRAQYEAANQQLVTAKEPSFTRKVNALWGNKIIPKWMERVTGKFQSISRHLYNFQFQTEKHPDIVAWSDSNKSVLLIESTVPREENRVAGSHERKKNRYETLRANCVERVGYAMWFLLRLVVLVF